MACSFNFKTGLIRGNYYNLEDKEERVYYHNIGFEPEAFPSQNYAFILNNDAKGKSKGFKIVYYSEIRFWREFRPNE